MAAALGARQGAFTHTAARRSVPAPVQRAPLHVCASYKNKENVDLAQLPAFAKHSNDTGGTEVQIARLTARVRQISSHLKEHRKDHSGTRGLEAVLAQRKKLMRYLYKTDRTAYDRVCVELGIRSVVAGDTHKAQQRAAKAAAEAAAQ